MTRRRVFEALLLLVILPGLVLAACARPAASRISPATITAITPDGGDWRGGTTVTIAGSGFFDADSGRFAGALLVTVCGAALTDVQVHGEPRTIVLPGGGSTTVTYGNTITGVTGQAAGVGAGDVVVRRPDGGTTTLAGAFDCFDSTPSVLAFSADDADAVVGDTIAFSWSLHNPAATELSCTLDAGDGTDAVTLESCDEGAQHRYLVAGEHTATLVIAAADGSGDTATTAVTIADGTELAANDDEYTTNAGMVLEVAAPGLLANDHGVPPPTVVAGTAASVHGGSAELAATGGFTYTPPAGYGGSDSFTYTIENGIGDPATATVTINVLTAPSAVDDEYATAFRAPLLVSDPTLGLLANDSGYPAPTVSPRTGSQGTPFGSYDYELYEDGTFEFYPDDDFTGSAVIPYTIESDLGSADAALIVAVGAAAVAVDDAAAGDTLLVLGNVTRSFGPARSFDPLANDTGDAIVLIGVAANSERGGTVELDMSTFPEFRYTPPPGHQGPDSFQYTIANGFGESHGTVHVDVAGMIWFVDASGQPGGDGTVNSPATSLASLHGNHGPDDTIFIHGSAAPYDATTLQLQPGTRLITQAAKGNLSELAGVVVPPDSDPLPDLLGGTTLTLLNIDDHTLQLSTDNQIHGVRLTGSHAGAEPFALAGKDFGTFTATRLEIDAPGSAVRFDNGVLDMEIGQFDALFLQLLGVAGRAELVSGTISSGADDHCIELETTLGQTLAFHVSGMLLEDCDVGVLVNAFGSGTSVDMVLQDVQMAEVAGAIALLANTGSRIVAKIDHVDATSRSTDATSGLHALVYGADSWIVLAAESSTFLGFFAGVDLTFEDAGEQGGIDATILNNELGGTNYAFRSEQADFEADSFQGNLCLDVRNNDFRPSGYFFLRLNQGLTAFEGLAEEHVGKTGLDQLDAVLDWLIDRSNGPITVLGLGGTPALERADACEQPADFGVGVP